MNNIQNQTKKAVELEDSKIIKERLKRWGNKPINVGTCFFFEHNNTYCCVHSCSDASDYVKRYGILWATTDEGFINGENTIGEGKIAEGSILESGDPIDFETFNASYQYAKNALNNLQLKLKSYEA